MYRQYTNSLVEPRPFRDVASQLQELTQDFTTSFNTGNYDQAANLFAADGVLMAPLEEAAYGQKQVERLLRRMGEQGCGDLRMETIRVDHSVDMAMEIGRFTLIVRSPGGAATEQHGKYVKVWKRLGAWLVMAECWSRTTVTASDRAA